MKDNNFIYDALSDLKLKTAGCFHSLRDVTHYMKGHFQKSIIKAT